MKTLGEIFEIVSGGTPSKSHPEYYDGNIPWVKTGDLKDEYLYSVEDCISEEGLNNSSAKMYPSGTVLIAMYGATIGATSILKFDACTNQACAAFKPCEEVLPEYLYFFLRSKKQKFISDGVGGAQPNISAGYLKKVSIDIRNIKEQEKIVTVLDKLNGIIQKRQKEIDELNELIKARFVETFGDPVSPTNEQKADLEEICEKITDGEHGSVTRISEGHPFLNAKHILKNGQIDWNTITFIGDDDHKRIYKRCNPEEGDILLTTTGTIGNVAIMPVHEEVSMDRGITLLKIDHKKVTSEFVAELLKQPSVQAEMGVNVHASAIGHLFMNKVKKLPAIIPSMDKQIEFTDFVKQADKSKVAVQKALDETRTLFDSLMQEYFG